MSGRAWSLIVLLGGIWGASYMFIEIGLRDLSPGMVAWLRVALAALTLLALASWSGALRGFGHRVGTIFLVAACQIAAPFLLIAAGQQEITSSMTGILISSAPLFTALLAIWVDHEERSQGSRLAGIALGSLGVVVLLGLDLGGTGDRLLGGFAVVLAAFCYAVAGLLAKRRLPSLPPLGVAAWVVSASVVLLAPAAIVGSPEATPGLGPVVAIAALGVIGTGVAFAIFYRLIATVGPARTYVVSYLAPGFAVVYGALLLDESISPATIGGLALILVGSWLSVEGKLSFRRRSGEGDAPGRAKLRGSAQPRAIPRTEER